MLIRSVAPRGCRRLLQHHGTRISGKQPIRCLTTDIQANEAALEQQLRQAASVAQPGLPSASPTQSEARAPRRRRRRKDATPPRDPIVDDYLANQHMQRTTGPLGSSFSPGYHPSNLLRNPPSPSDVTLELLLASQTHLGHSTSLWNPASSRYIFGIRQGIHIISLDTTAQYLRRAAKVVSGVAERGGLILFVGTRPGFDRIVVRAAQLAAPACHLFERWTPGSITNGQQILGRCGMRVVDEFDSEIDGFEDQLFDRNALKPDLVVCLNPLENYVMLHECALATIPTIGVIDTDADPTWVTYPIPANDDSLRSIQVIAGVLGRAGEAGQKKRRDAAIAGRISYRAPEQLSLPDDFDIPAFKQSKDSKKAAFKSGLADLALLTDSTLGSAMSKLSDSEKKSLSEGEEDVLDTVGKRLNPQESVTLKRYFESNRKMNQAQEAAMAKERDEKERLSRRGQDAKARAREAAANAARGRGAAGTASQQRASDQNDEEEANDPSNPLERTRRAAARSYFSRETAEKGMIDDDRQGQAPDLLQTLQQKLSQDELNALRSAEDFDLESVRTKLTEDEFDELESALAQINGRGMGGEEGVDEAVEAEAYETGAYDPEMGSRDQDYVRHSEDEDEGQMGYQTEGDEMLNDTEQERRGLGHADEGDLEGSSRNTGR